MAKDYYIILGVDPDATQEQIRSAYRRQARKLHPDHSGEGCEPFLALQEAYEGLRDPVQRKGHDDELARVRRRQHTFPEVRGEPMRSRRCSAEPLIPGQGTNDLRDLFSSRRPPSLFDSFPGRLWDDWDPAPQSTDCGDQDVAVEIALTREQAIRGGRIRIWIPVEVRCPECHGRGGTGFFTCVRCSSRGTVRGQVPVVLAFEPGLVEGYTRRMSLSPLGLGQSTLTVAFRVRGR